MKFLTGLLLMAASVHAHYRFSRLIVDGVPEPREWMSVRQTKSYQGNQGVSDVGSADMRCHQMLPGRQTAAVRAGADVGFVVNAQVSHFGPLSFYMARAPDAADLNAWEPAGAVWFKVAAMDGVRRGAEWVWPAMNAKTVSFTIPAAVPDGKYLIRVESVALHQAQAVGGAQIYIACAQVEVSGGGGGQPAPLVAIPGAYRADDPGLLWSYYPVKTSYRAPGPDVWQG